jgi:hypothetical protein
MDLLLRYYFRTRQDFVFEGENPSKLSKQSFHLWVLVVMSNLLNEINLQCHRKGASQ